MTNEQYYDLRTPYNDALQIMRTRINILDHNLYHKIEQWTGASCSGTNQI